MPDMPSESREPAPGDALQPRRDREAANGFHGFLLWADRRTSRFLSHFGSMVVFLQMTNRWAWRYIFSKVAGIGFWLTGSRKQPRHAKLMGEGAVVKQMESAGTQSLGIVSLVAFLVGVTIVLQVIALLARFGQKDIVAAVIGITMVRELGPLITAIIFAGRVGAAYTAELGTMKVQEELLALETMGLNPVGYLVVPRYLSALLVVPALTIIATFVGMFGGYLIAMQYGVTSTAFLDNAQEFLRAKDVIFGILKAHFFAVIIVIVSCYKGFTVEGGGEEVGRSTMEAVVITIVAIIFSDTIFTMIFNLTEYHGG